MPGAELYGEKRLQSAWKVKKSSSSNSNTLCLCSNISKLLTQSALKKNQNNPKAPHAVMLQLIRRSRKTAPNKGQCINKWSRGGPKQVSCLTEAPPKPGWGEHPVSGQPWSSSKAHTQPGHTALCHPELHRDLLLNLPSRLQENSTSYSI